MNWMTSGRHRALGTRNARKKRLQMQLPAHVQRESERRRLQSQQRQGQTSSLQPELPLPTKMRVPDDRARCGSEHAATETPWYILPMLDMDESQDIQMLEFGRMCPTTRVTEFNHVDHKSAAQQSDKHANLVGAIQVVEHNAPTPVKAPNNPDERCVFTPVKPGKHKQADRGSRTLVRPRARQRILPDNDILLLNKEEHMSQLNPSEHVSVTSMDLERANTRDELLEKSRSNSEKRGDASQRAAPANLGDDGYHSEHKVTCPDDRFGEEWCRNDRVAGEKCETRSPSTTQNDAAVSLRTRFGSQPSVSSESSVAYAPRIQFFANETSKGHFIFGDDQSSDGSDNSSIRRRSRPSLSMIQSRSRTKTGPQNHLLDDRQIQEHTLESGSGQLYKTLSVRNKQSPSKSRKVSDQIGTAVERYHLEPDSSSVSSQDSIIWSCPPMNWQKQLFQLQNALHGEVRLPASASTGSSNGLSPNSSPFAKSLISQVPNEGQIATRAESYTREREYCSIGQVLEKKELRVEGNVPPDFNPSKQTASWMMASRTEKILQAVRANDHTDASRQPASSVKVSINSSSMKEMTSVAIYFCSMVECYKIDETIRSEASPSRFEQI